MDILKLGEKVLKDEARALIELSEKLNSGFLEAIDCLYGIKGRMVLTGMGKSGLVARKVAATLSSTGSPAFFIHPSEASHGDLGLISEDDALLAFSWSGNTKELSDILHYTISRGIPVIGITRDRNSLLGKNSSYLLELPELPEADILDCAPTTSTTMQMALGDAIAIGLMHKRGISEKDFHRWHPGGSLGRKLYLVSDLMHKGDEIPLVDADYSMSEVILQISAKGFGVSGITRGEELYGIITDGDLRRHMTSDLLSRKAYEVMTEKPVVIEEDRLAAEALGLMRAKNITALFVVRENKPIGLLHMRDLLHIGAPKP